MSENAGAHTTPGDPLRTLADALETAAQTVRDGAVGASATVNKALPAASHFVSRFVYTTCYTFSYGLVFPTVLLAKSIPANNAVVHGFVDGAQAAVDTLDQLKQRHVAAPRALSNSSPPS
jgi:hypothetical protein